MTMRRQALLLLLLSTAAAAQITIEGDVVRRSTGAPLAGALVSGGGCVHMPPAPVETDASGHFRLFGAVATSPCLVGISGPGLLTSRRWLTIGLKDTHISLRAEVTALAVIKGKVLDENGRGMQADVCALQYYRDNGVHGPQVPRRVQANDLGEYRIGDLPPGRYYLWVQPRLPDYLPTWYRPTGDTGDAGPVDLTDGQEAGIDIHFAPGGGVEVRGQVIPPASVQLGRISFGVTRVDEWQTSPVPSARLAPDGTFTLRHVAPGKYAFTATTSGLQNAPPINLAWRLVEVKSENIDGIILNVTPTALRDLRGNILSDVSVKPEQVQIALNRAAGGGVRLVAKVAPDGSFVIPGVWPGLYTGYAFANGGVPVSFRLGSQEIMGSLSDFDGADAPLRVTVAGPAVALMGTVQYSNNHPVTGARIVFAPMSPTFAPFALKYRGISQNAGTDQNGAMIAAQVPPGSYRVYVIENPADTDRMMADPAFVASQNRLFAPVTVKPRDNPPLSLVLPAN
jgi:hypothetical protein